MCRVSSPGAQCKQRCLRPVPFKGPDRWDRWSVGSPPQHKITILSPPERRSWPLSANNGGIYRTHPVFAHYGSTCVQNDLLVSCSIPCICNDRSPFWICNCSPCKDLFSKQFLKIIEIQPIRFQSDPFNNIEVDRTRFIREKKIFCIYNTSVEYLKKQIGYIRSAYVA